jgi:uncharacterized protein with GYD domain
MPLFMYQFSYTPESWAAQLKAPQNRLESVGSTVCEAAGGRMVGGWYCFGEYDAVLIAELPDNESMAGLALALGAGGALKSSKTTVLMSGPQAVTAMSKGAATAKSYRPAR